MTMEGLQGSCTRTRSSCYWVVRCLLVLRRHATAWFSVLSVEWSDAEESADLDHVVVHDDSDSTRQLSEPHL